jgi:TrmH family RNA methyltransferase
MVLTSKNNPLIKETASLKDKKGRRATGLFLVEGVKMTKECARSGLEIDKIFVEETRVIPDELSAYADKIVWVSEAVMGHLSDEKTPQGVLCRVKIPQNALEKPVGSCLILDDVSDPSNIGAIVRSANGAGYAQVYLTKDCADPYAPKCVRASMSGLFFTKLYIAPREEILEVFKDTPIVVADMGGVNAFTFDAPRSFGLVIGNEGNGVSDAVRSKAKYTVKIPMRETQESLNASVSAGILMYLLKREEFSLHK